MVSLPGKLAGLSRETVLAFNGDMAEFIPGDFPISVCEYTRVAGRHILIFDLILPLRDSLTLS